MTQPFSRIPEPEIPRPFKRRLQPTGIPQAVLDAWGRVKRQSGELWRQGKRQGEELWRKGKRHPRMLGMIGGAAALTVVGAYTLSATGSGHSLCASALGAKNAKTPKFVVLMEPIGSAAVGSDLEIRYDVCGLPSGSDYRGRVEITQRVVTKKKKGSPKPKSLAVNFKDESDGLATSKEEEVELRNLKPGAYTLQLTVVDKQGRERKALQKIQLKPR
jgi:hypothetical protein